MIWRAAIVGLAFWAWTGSAVKAQPVVVDLSSDFVAITAGFTGTEVLLFGATSGYGEVVVVIEGPKELVGVRRKEQIAGIWVNGRQVDFKDVPAFYQVLSTNSLDEWLPLAVREENQIGVEYLNLKPHGEIGAAEASEYRAALIRNAVMCSFPRTYRLANTSSEPIWWTRARSSARGRCRFASTRSASKRTSTGSHTSTARFMVSPPSSSR